MTGLLLACTALAGGSGWYPLGHSELRPHTERGPLDWRGGTIAEAEAFQAALDGSDRLLVLTATPGPEFELVLHEYRSEGWHALPAVATVRADWLPPISLTTDAADRPVVAWVSDDRIRVARLTGSEWRPLLDAPDGAGVHELVVRGQPEIELVVADSHELLPRLRVGAVEHGSWTPATQTRSMGHPRLVATDSIAGDRDWTWASTDVVKWDGRWRSRLPERFSARPRRFPMARVTHEGRTLTVYGAARLVRTHLEDEANRWIVVRGRRPFASRLRPERSDALEVSHQFVVDGALSPFPRERPTLVLRTGLGVAAVEWTGRDWWGLGARPEPESGGLGPTDAAAIGPTFVPADPGPVLQWFETRDGVGHVPMQASWSGTAWSQSTPERPKPPHAAPCGSIELVEFAGAGMTSTVTTSDGTWDRLYGVRDGSMELFVVAPGRWERAAQSRWGADTPTEADCLGVQGMGCAPAATASNGSEAWVLGSTWGQDERSPTLRVSRWEAGRWREEIVRGSHTHSAEDRALHVGRHGAVFATHGRPWGGHWRSAVTVYARQGASWSPLSDIERVAWVARSDEDLNQALGLGLAVAALPQGGAAAAWRLPEDPWTLQTAVWWRGGVQRLAAVPANGGRDFALDATPDGRPILVWSHDDDLHLGIWDGASWAGLSGSDARGGVSNSEAASTQPDLYVGDDQVCVAWQETGRRRPRVLLRCHHLPQR